MRLHAQAIESRRSTRTEFLPVSFKAPHTATSLANVLHMSGPLGGANRLLVDASRWLLHFNGTEDRLPFRDAVAYADPKQRGIMLTTLSAALRLLVADWHSLNGLTHGTVSVVLLASGADALVAHDVLPQLVANKTST